MNTNKLFTFILSLIFIFGCESDLEKGKKEIQKRNWGEAINYLERDRKKFPNDVEARILLSKAYLKSDDSNYEHVIYLLSSVEDSNYSTQINSYLTLAFAYSFLDKIKTNDSIDNIIFEIAFENIFKHFELLNFSLIDTFLIKGISNKLILSFDQIVKRVSYDEYSKSYVDLLEFPVSVKLLSDKFNSFSTTTRLHISETDLLLFDSLRVDIELIKNLNDSHNALEIKNYKLAQQFMKQVNKESRLYKLLKTKYSKHPPS